MRTLAALMFTLLLSVPALADPFLITGGSYFQGIGGIKYDFFGDNFAARGTDTIGFGFSLNDTLFRFNDLNMVSLLQGPTLRQAENVTESLFTFSGNLLGGNPGHPPQSFQVVGAGIGTVTSLGAGLTNLALNFADLRGSALVHAPEPTTWVLLGSGVVALLLWRRFRLTPVK